MLKRNLLVGLSFLLFSLNVLASEADLAKEAKKYKSLKELCIKSKEWSPMGRIGAFIRWSADSESCKFMPIPPIKDSEAKYSSLAPYVFANSKRGNVLLNVKGFSFHHKKKNNGYILTLSSDGVNRRDGIKKDKLNEIYAEFYKKYKKINFKSEKEVRSLKDEKASIRWTYKMLYMSRGGIDAEGQRQLNEDLRKATPKTLTWDTTTFNNNGDKLLFKVTTVITSKKTKIDGDIIYTAK